MPDHGARLNAAWASAQARLPPGWAIDGLRCASTGLAEEDRSDEWIAVAVGPTGEERRRRAAEPMAALEALAASFAPADGPRER